MSLRFGEPAVARKVGEGYDKPNADQELPIDINYKTLTDWLVRVLAAEAPLSATHRPLITALPNRRSVARSCRRTGTNACRSSRPRLLRR